MNLKNSIRQFLIFLKLDITKNLEYDRLTQRIIKKVLSKNSNCIDVGCHNGEVLQIMLKHAPKGKHFAFEPIPAFYKELSVKFLNQAEIFPFALAEKAGTSSFQYVKNLPAYSGLQKRRYDIKHPEIEEIQVEIKTLDEIIPQDIKIDFIKIDVEGGEFGVLKGAKETLKRNKPLIIFEFGLGASDYYKITPKDIYNLLEKEIGLSINTLKSFLKKEAPLTLTEFENLYQSNKEYYFIASSF